MVHPPLACCACTWYLREGGTPNSHPLAMLCHTSLVSFPHRAVTLRKGPGASRFFGGLFLFGADTEPSCVWTSLGPSQAYRPTRDCNFSHTSLSLPSVPTLGLSPSASSNHARLLRKCWVSSTLSILVHEPEGVWTSYLATCTIALHQKLTQALAGRTIFLQR